ncbi:serin endopeptidase [Metarhizium acridum CQMa 102]|uniref:Serin endopeptidase n=1 Tax=Metarhizium acridum (strain CQMa 102) TaxID=655827 RepID=E9DZ74_METAQ|nr:serine endopeptidase [Metarhizium acridum CQMa 102]EFY91036.1 serin endopeptidase [Metarhizium acridum CQMa 102]
MVKRSAKARSLGKRISAQNRKSWKPKKVSPQKPPCKVPPPPKLPPDLQDCARNFTAACYRALYQIPFASTPVPGYEPAVNTPYIPNGTHPAPHSVDGAQAPVPLRSPQNGGESDIDIDIVQSFILPQSMLLYQVDDIYYSSKSNLSGFPDTFLDALDTATRRISIRPATAPVISISYGESELDVPKKYMQRQCNEFLKLGLQGTTVLVSSGDYGVGIGPGANACLNGSGQTNTIYNPGNPSIVHDAEVALQTPLPGTELFASGGGFSNYFPAPEYQRSAVQSYLARHDPGHRFYVADDNASNIGADGGLYNRAGRGIPDVAANGANFRAFTNGSDGHCSELVSPHCCGAPSSP